MSKEVKQIVNFEDKARELVFFDDFISLKKQFGFSFRKLFKKFYFPNGDHIIFKIAKDEMFRFFKKNYGDFDELRGNDLIEYFEVDENDPLREIVKEDEFASLKWKPINDEDKAEIFWILVDPEKTYLSVLDYIFGNDETYWFAFENYNGDTCVVIFWKRDLNRFKNMVE